MWGCFALKVGEGVFIFSDREAEKACKWLIYLLLNYQKMRNFSKILRKREKNVQLLPKKKPTFKKVGFLK